MHAIQWPDSRLQRLCFIAHDDDEADALLDAACLSQANAALIHSHGALINNISVAENLLLVSCWHKRQAIDPLLQRAQSILQQWLPTDHHCQGWLLKRPAELLEEQRRLIVLLRAALSEPELLLIAHDWFNVRGKSKDRSAVVLREHFTLCRWWWFCTETESATHENWHTITRDVWQPNPEVTAP